MKKGPLHLFPLFLSFSMFSRKLFTFDDHLHVVHKHYFTFLLIIFFDGRVSSYGSTVCNLYKKKLEFFVASTSIFCLASVWGQHINVDISVYLVCMPDPLIYISGHIKKKYLIDLHLLSIDLLKRHNLFETQFLLGFVTLIIFNLENQIFNKINSFFKSSV